MKILFLADRLENGGAETHIETLACGLAARGHEVTVLSAGGRVADRLKACGIRCIWDRPLGRSPLRFLLGLLFLRRLLRRERFDILHAHTRARGALLGCLSPRFGVRVFTCHAARCGALTRLACRGSAVIAVSEDLREGLLRCHAVPAEAITVIPNGIELGRFFPPKQPPDPQSVLFASRLDPDCSLGAELLLSVAPSLLSRFPMLRITLAGGGRMLGRLRRRAAAVDRLAGRQVVTFCGAVEDMASLYRSHQAVLGVSRVALEAAACGCSVLLIGNEGYGGRATAVETAPALSNFCCRGLGRATEQRLLADLSALLAEVSDEPTADGGLRAWVMRDFSSEGMTEATERLYARLLRDRAEDGETVRVLVGGYAGCGNLGDDAILSGLTDRLRTEQPSLALSALTGSPVRDGRRFGIPCFDRRRPLSVLTAMLRADVFLLGGGSLLQDGTGRLSLWYYLFLLRLARALGCRTGTVALGIGPLCSPRSERAVLRELSACDAVLLRDTGSMRFLSEHGFDRSRMGLVSDPACFLPKPPPMRRAALLHRLGLPQSCGYFCAVVRPTVPESDTALRVLAAALRCVALTHGLAPILPILDTRQDRTATERVVRLAGCGRSFCPDEPADLTALLGGAELVVTMRLHAMLLAETVGVTSVALSHDAREPKLDRFAQRLGRAHFRAAEVGVVSLAAEMEQILAKKRK